MNEPLSQARDQINQLIKDIANVQPMPSTVIKDIYAAGKSREWLIDNGYEPVSELKLVWVRKTKQ